MSSAKLAKLVRHRVLRLVEAIVTYAPKERDVDVDAIQEVKECGEVNFKKGTEGFEGVNKILRSNECSGGCCRFLLL